MPPVHGGCSKPRVWRRCPCLAYPCSRGLFSSKTIRLAPIESTRLFTGIVHAQRIVIRYRAAREDCAAGKAPPSGMPALSAWTNTFAVPAVRPLLAKDFSVFWRGGKNPAQLRGFYDAPLVFYESLPARHGRKRYRKGVDGARKTLSPRCEKKQALRFGRRKWRG